MAFLATEWFQLGAVPILLAIVSGIAGALASRDRVARLEHWLIGTDLCLEALAINLAFAIAAASQMNVTGADHTTDLIAFLAGGLVLELLTLMSVIYVVRFFGVSATTFIGTTLAGIVAVWGTLVLWTAQ